MPECIKGLSRQPEGVILNGNMFQGSEFVLRPSPYGLRPVEIFFNIKRDRTLPPFYYHKPIYISGSDLKLPPVSYVRDVVVRERYYPLAIVTQAYREPYHLDKAEDALFAAVEVVKDGETRWETRYFPKSLIESFGIDTWTEAEIILKPLPTLPDRRSF